VQEGVRLLESRAKEQLAICDSVAERKDLAKVGKGERLRYDRVIEKGRTKFKRERKSGEGGGDAASRSAVLRL
jgi:hypothetical protein